MQTMAQLNYAIPSLCLKVSRYDHEGYMMITGWRLFALFPETEEQLWSITVNTRSEKAIAFTQPQLHVAVISEDGYFKANKDAAVPIKW